MRRRNSNSLLGSFLNIVRVVCVIRRRSGRTTDGPVLDVFVTKTWAQIETNFEENIIIIYEIKSHV